MKTINFLKTALLTIALFVCGNVGAEEIAYTLNCIKATTNSSYSSYYNVTINGIQWNAPGNQALDGFWRIGGKNMTNEDRVLTSKNSITSEISKIILSHDGTSNSTIKINYVSLEIASDAEFTNIIETKTLNNLNITSGTAGTIEITPTNTTWPENSYYKFILNITNTGGNAGLNLVKIDFYSATTSSVATPTFSVQTGKYTKAQNVTIDCVTPGASIYYTIDESEPSEHSTLYNGAINISSTTTLKAIAIIDGESSAVATATYTFPTEVADIAAYNALEKNTFTKITGAITVSYINGSNIYAQDETGAMLIYDYDYAQTEGLAAGATISNLIGTKSEHGGAAQMAEVISSTIGEGTTTLVPTTVPSVTEADLHKYVKLEDAQFDQSYSFTDNERINATLSTHGEIVVRNNFKNFTMDVTATDKYDIIGFVSVFNGQVQIYPISIDVTTPSITLSTNSLAFETVENGQTKDLTFTVNGANLSGDATLAISGDNADYFTCNPTSITPAEDGSIAETTITVTYQPTATGEHAATLTITCSDLVKEIALTGTCISPVLAAPVAAEATAITANGFTANWEAVENATSYEVNVWKETNVYATDLIISEYVEGSSSNKYIEIYNGTGSSIDLSDYKLQMYANGNSTPSNDIQLEGTLEHNTCKVYKNSSANIYDGNAENNAAVNFNGNDAIALYKISTESYVDIFGVIGKDPGSAWTCEEHSTSDKTLRRKSTVREGIKTNPADFTTLCTEWEVSNKDDVSNLGQHNMLNKANAPIAGSPFTVTGLTNTAIINLAEETTYYYNVVAKANGYTASEASNTISVTTAAEVAEPTITIEGEDLIETEGMYSVALGDTKFSTRTSKTFTLTATGVTNTVEITPEMGSLFFVTVTSEQATENMGILTFTPNEKKEVNATFTISNRINNEFNIFGFDNGEALMQAYRQSYGMAQNSPWYIINGDIRKVITVSLTPVEESAGTGLCDQPEMEGISFNGEEIINSLNLDVAVYNAIGQMVVRSNENINMSSYPAGVYVIKAANGESMKIVK